jgi:hypothetical protein
VARRARLSPYQLRLEFLPPAELIHTALVRLVRPDSAPLADALRRAELRVDPPHRKLVLVFPSELARPLDPVEKRALSSVLRYACPLLSEAWALELVAPRNRPEPTPEPLF